MAVNTAAYAITDAYLSFPQYPAAERWSKEPGETDLLDGDIFVTDKKVDMLQDKRRSSRRGRRKPAAMYRRNFARKWNVSPIRWKLDRRHSERKYYDIASNNKMLI